MGFLKKLKRNLEVLAVPHLTEILIFGQVAVFVATSAGWLETQNVLLIPERVLAGEYRRLAMFLFVPPAAHPIFLAFAWMFFYFMGKALETQWGEFNYNLYIFIAYAATVAASFLTPHLAVTSAFIASSIFLAFAFLYPDFVIYIFFIIPVKIKWVAAFTWASYVLGFIFGNYSSRLQILASLCNFILFFGGDLFRMARYGGKKIATQTQEITQAATPFHRCQTCGISDRSHPEMEFRYCTRCVREAGYCTGHIRNHEHILS